MTCCWHTKIHLFVTLIVIIGALNWGSQGLFCYNFVDDFSINLKKLLGTKICFNRYIYILVGICGLILATKRNTWLPFLGKTILPEYTVLLHKPHNANKKISINATPYTKIIYWTGMYDKWDSDIKIKMKENHNSRHCGVVMSDEFGNAELLFEDYDDLDKTFKHIHYRELGLSHHMMSEVKKIYF